MGDEKAFRICFECWHNRLYAASLSYLKVHEAAEDVVQQVFIKLWERKLQLPEIEKPLDYLFVICRNECLDILRKLAANNNYVALMSELFEPTIGGPDQQLITKEIRELFIVAVNELPSQQREVWRLVREEGMSYKQAAELMGLTAFTVKAYLARATKKIASQIRKHHPDLYVFFAVWLLR